MKKLLIMMMAVLAACSMLLAGCGGGEKKAAEKVMRVATEPSFAPFAKNSPVLTWISSVQSANKLATK